MAGVVSYDNGRDLADPNSVIAIEVYEDQEALQCQESLPEVDKVLGLLEEIVVAEPDATVFEVASSAPRWV